MTRAAICFALIFLCLLGQKILIFLNFQTLLMPSTTIQESLSLLAKSLRYDFSLASAIGLIVLLPVAIRSLAPRAFSRRVEHGLFFFALLVLGCLQIIDANYFSYYHHRFHDFFWEFFDNFENMKLVAGSVGDTTAFGLCGMIAVVHCAAALLYWRFVIAKPEDGDKKNLWLRSSLGFVTLLLLITGARGIGQIPLPVASEQKKRLNSHDYFLNQLDTNSAYALLEAYRDHSIWFATAAAKPLVNYPELAASWKDLEGKPYLPHLRVESNSASPDRVLNPVFSARKPKNIVVITMESLNAWPLDSKELKLGEILAEIRENSMEWTRYFPAGKGTLNNNLKVNLGIPTPSSFPPETSYSEGLDTSLESLPRALKKEGWASHYFFGGSLGWHQIGYLMKELGFDDVRGEESLGDVDKTPFGLHDEDLFDLALNALDNAKGPSYFQIMTLSNHPPFKIPGARDNDPRVEYTPALAVRVIDDEKFQKRFRAYRYSVEALRDFLAKAKTKPWFDETVFVITADHGIEDTETDGLSARKPNEFMELRRIPLIVYAPKFFSPKKVETTGSHLDLMPTVLAMVADKPISFRSFGHNLLDPAIDDASTPKITYGNDFTCARQFCLSQGYTFLEAKPKVFESCPESEGKCREAQIRLSHFREIYDRAGFHYLFSTRAMHPVTH